LSDAHIAEYRAKDGLFAFPEAGVQQAKGGRNFIAQRLLRGESEVGGLEKIERHGKIGDVPEYRFRIDYGF